MWKRFGTVSPGGFVTVGQDKRKHTMPITHRVRLKRTSTQPALRTSTPRTSPTSNPKPHHSTLFTNRWHDCVDKYRIHSYSTHVPIQHSTNFMLIMTSFVNSHACKWLNHYAILPSRVARFNPQDECPPNSAILLPSEMVPPTGWMSNLAQWSMIAIIIIKPILFIYYFFLYFSYE